MPSDPRVVLDTSVIVALILGETRAERVRPVLGRSVVSAVNLAEAMEVISRKGQLSERSKELLLSISIEPLDKGQAIVAGALLLAHRRTANLSLGDACCLALGTALGAEVFTWDRNWAEIPMPIAVRIIG